MPILEILLAVSLVSSTPAHRAVHFEAEDGTTIHADYYPAQGRTSQGPLGTGRPPLFIRQARTAASTAASPHGSSSSATRLWPSISARAPRDGDAKTRR